MATATTIGGVRLLSQTVAQGVDVTLMDPAKGGFSIFQLMELAGLSVAQAVLKAYPLAQFPKVLVVAGNNGGDALVAARHLRHFGYSPRIVYPKQPQKELFLGLVTQCRSLGIPVDTELTDFDCHVVLDGIFGFSFSGDIRPPFDSIIQRIKASGLPVAAIDIPSGWDVEEGNKTGAGLEPDTLISLTAPKLCARHFKGRKHYLGGRFVPPTMERELGLNLPPYPDGDQVVELPVPAQL
ncbi:NAD(P)H-hydrate epimerase [Phlyctochytrium bullatum]|nr:NAD(P)H-hydrate epimerase [Phlyctochytrium bullatum]